MGLAGAGRRMQLPGGGSDSDSSKFPRAEGTTERQRPAMPTGGAAAPCPATSQQEISKGDRNSQGAQSAASVTLILPKLSTWVQLPPAPGKHCPALDQCPTQPQLSPPSCSRGCPTFLARWQRPLWTGLSLSQALQGPGGLQHGQPESRADGSGLATGWGQE